MAGNTSAVDSRIGEYGEQFSSRQVVESIELCVCCIVSHIAKVRHIQRVGSSPVVRTVWERSAVARRLHGECPTATTDCGIHEAVHLRIRGRSRNVEADGVRTVCIGSCGILDVKT